MSFGKVKGTYQKLANFRKWEHFGMGEKGNDSVDTRVLEGRRDHLSR